MAVGRCTTPAFIGVDLGWYGKPTGLASIVLNGEFLSIRAITRLESTPAILGWIEEQTGAGNAVVGVDAPLIIRSHTGIRPAERELNAEFRRYHAGCHAANLSRPFAANVLSFSQSLCSLGFAHGADMAWRQEGRFQIEVHPHAATVNFFDLNRIVKYKRGCRADRARGLRRLRNLMTSQLPELQPPSERLCLPGIPRTGNLKPTEDQIDAVLCAFIAAHWWFWGKGRNSVYGNQEEGYIIVPHRYNATDAKLKTNGSDGDPVPARSCRLNLRNVIQDR